jgi:hypothetical protein
MIVIAAVAIVAAWLNIPPAILLVITGVVLALIPGVPTVELAPEFVLLLVLPPAIYSSEVAMSWRDFRYNLRPISPLERAASCSRPSRLPRQPIGCWASCGRSALSWVRFGSCNLRTIESGATGSGGETIAPSFARGALDLPSTAFPH